MDCSKCPGGSVRLKRNIWIALLGFPHFVHPEAGTVPSIHCGERAKVFSKSFDSCSLWGSWVPAYQTLIGFSALMNRRVGHAWVPKISFEPNIKRYFDKKSSCCINGDAASLESYKRCVSDSRIGHIFLLKGSSSNKRSKDFAHNYCNPWQIHSNKKVPPTQSALFKPSVLFLIPSVYYFHISKLNTYHTKQKIIIKQIEALKFSLYCCAIGENTFSLVDAELYD